MKVIFEEESDIFVKIGTTGMILVTNKHTGRTFSLTQAEAKQLSTLLKLVIVEESTNPPEDQL